MQQNSSFTTVPASLRRESSWPMEREEHCAILPGHLSQPFCHSNALPLPGRCPPPPIYRLSAPQILQHPHYHHSMIYADPGRCSYHCQTQSAGAYHHFPGFQLGAFHSFTPSHPWQLAAQQPFPPYFRQHPPQYPYHRGFWGPPEVLMQSLVPVAMMTDPPLPPSFNRPMLSSGAHHSYHTPKSPDTLPRGPPRKPKQSDHALWVGNLPPRASVWDLKDHFSKGARKEIESVYFISKTNCAFVNYRTETACTSAMETFNNLAFQGYRLVCRPRKSFNSASATSASLSSVASSVFHHPSPVKSSVSGALNIKSRDEEQVNEIPGEEELMGTAMISERFFIIKCLTVEDLQQCVRDNIWATQPHNEQLLNSAYESGADVYLIFSANKSGEYFGYARMSSSISDHMKAITSTTNMSAGPTCLYTPATESAQKGRVVNDSARGTIFWESILSDDEEKQVDEACDCDRIDGDPQVWGHTFTVEWKSTRKVPFYRTRGMRNPWNANREVKVARDGTELEPSVGKRLVQLFSEIGPPPVSLAGT